MKQLLMNAKYFLRYYQRRILIITAIFTLLVGVGISFALDEDNALYSLICTMIDDIVSTKTIQEVEELVTVGFNTTSITLGGYTIENMGTVMSSVNDAMQVFALIFCTTLFFVGLTNAFLSQQAYEEIVIKRLVVLGITIGLIAWSMTLCLNIANLGSGMASKISQIASSTYDSQIDMINALKADIKAACSTADQASGALSKFGAMIADVFTALGYILQLFIPWVSMQAVKIVVKVTCWGRALEIIILACLSPLAFCDISSGQGTGMGGMGRFLKNFAATTIQGAIIILIMFFCSQIHLAIIAESGTAATFFNNTWNIVVIGFVEVGLCTKSQGIARQLVGVG